MAQSTTGPGGRGDGENAAQKDLVCARGSVPGSGLGREQRWSPLCLHGRSGPVLQHVKTSLLPSNEERLIGINKPKVVQDSNWGPCAQGEH